MTGMLPYVEGAKSRNVNDDAMGANFAVRQGSRPVVTQPRDRFDGPTLIHGSHSEGATTLGTVESGGVSVASSQSGAPGFLGTHESVSHGAGDLLTGEAGANPFDVLDAGGESSDIGLGSGVASRQPGTARGLEVGYQDSALGYVELHAHVAGGGIHASLVAQSTASGDALNHQLSSLASWLEERKTPVDSITVVANRDSSLYETAHGTGSNSRRDSSSGGGDQEPALTRYAEDVTTLRPAVVASAVSLTGASTTFTKLPYGSSISVLA
ncbi:flagellar hook-length control protein FliK [Acidicapsa ligni]|uniref:flagellar hook-length control protein FliK n=1 Tax=Acidicapsa ligni TaxID=542300 RepID=UPI0021DFE029|nr:flagellar hook-length control protein FliK [Acidicapsa ligni]